MPYAVLPVLAVLRQQRCDAPHPSVVLADGSTVRLSCRRPLEITTHTCTGDVSLALLRVAQSAGPDAVYLCNEGTAAALEAAQGSPEVRFVVSASPEAFLQNMRRLRLGAASVVVLDSVSSFFHRSRRSPESGAAVRLALQTLRRQLEQHHCLLVFGRCARFGGAHYLADCLLGGGCVPQRRSAVESAGQRRLFSDI